MRRLGQTRIVVIVVLMLIAVGLGGEYIASMGKPDNRAVVATNQALIGPPTATAALTQTYQAELATAEALTATAQARIPAPPTQMPQATPTFNAPFATERASLHATWGTGTATWQAAGFAAGATMEAQRQEGDATMTANTTAMWTEVAPTRSVIMQTESAIARTPEALRLTNTPFPTEVPQPTATPIMGIYTVDDETKRFDAYTTNGWQGMIDGELGGVIAGNKRTEGGHPGIGTLLIYKGNGGQLWTIFNPQSYELPTDIGIIKIEAVKNGLVTIVNTDPCYAPAKFIFDLKTRQWINPPQPNPTPQLGLLQPDRSCLGWAGNLFINAWRGEVGGKFITIAAGAGSWYYYYGPLDAPTSPGMVFVSNGPNLVFDNTGIRTPFAVGPVHIVSVSGNIMTVANKDNSATFLFDINKGQFVSPPAIGPQIPIGFLGDCHPTGNPRPDDCWRGVINGKFVTVAVGDDDYLQRNIISVFNGPDFSDAHPRVYPEPPTILGSYIYSAVGSKLFIYNAMGGRDNITFDIVTGQFDVAAP